MQATPQTLPETERSLPAVVRGLAWFLLIPLLTFLVIALGIAWQLEQYQQHHAGRIYTGITVDDIDVGGLTPAEAEARLAATLPMLQGPTVTLVDPAGDREWTATPAELGIRYDVSATLEEAYQFGRTGDRQTQLRQQFAAWYHGYPLTARITIDESALDGLLDTIAAAIETAPIAPSLDIRGSEVDAQSGQMGYTLDKGDARARLTAAVNNLAPAQIELLIHTTQPRLVDATSAANLVNQIIASPVDFYFEEPLDGVDLQSIRLPQERLVEWVRVELVENAGAADIYEVTLDEDAARAWLAEYAPRIAREPERARFYFDDYTGELVLIEPHKDGRYLDVDATLERLLAAVRTPNRKVPLAIGKVVPVVNSNATADDLGITELLSQATTWFAGSSEERMANIARAASNFYGIVVAPGEEFSFNQYLGEISEEQGYERGLIIAGGRTIEGVGGGVCQVSTTLFQAAFFSGLDIGSGQRWPHGYRVAYYESGLGPGFDATIYSPEIDLTFTNDTPHHLLIENYYNETDQSLTFKLYSTSIGRTVEWERWIANETDPRPDVWEYNPELESGQIEQVDWAVPGADVTVRWTVYNQWGELRHQKDFVSNYIPWANIYQYGPDTDISNGP